MGEQIDEMLVIFQNHEIIAERLVSLSSFIEDSQCD